jgi:nucleoside-diphosphate-sugar epimerase
MSVVITGAAGFIGSTLVRHLLEQGHDVVAVDREPVVPRPGLSAIRGDLLESAEARQALREASCVIHLAASSGVRDDRADIEERRHRDNVLASAVVAETVPRDVPLLMMSSSSVYGGSGGRPSRETDGLRPRGDYARSKVAVESVCAVRAENGGHVLVIRPFTVIGEGQRADMALSLWADALRAGRPARVFGSLDRTRDVTCVRETARALTALATNGATGTVNLGTGRPRTLGELVVAVGSAVGDPRPVVELVAAEPREVEQTWADTTRLRGLVGFSPHTDLYDAVRRAVAVPLTERLEPV